MKKIFIFIVFIILLNVVNLNSEPLFKDSIPQYVYPEYVPGNLQFYDLYLKKIIRYETGITLTTWTKTELKLFADSVLDHHQYQLYATVLNVSSEEEIYNQHYNNDTKFYNIAGKKISVVTNPFYNYVSSIFTVNETEEQNSTIIDLIEQLFVNYFRREAFFIKEQVTYSLPVLKRYYDNHAVNFETDYLYVFSEPKVYQKVECLNTIYVTKMSFGSKSSEIKGKVNSKGRIIISKKDKQLLYLRNFSYYYISKVEGSKDNPKWIKEEIVLKKVNRKKVP